MAKKLSGEEKAAVLLFTLGENAAAEVMRHLEPKDIRRLGGPLTALSNLTPDLRDEVMREFRSMSSGTGNGVEGKDFLRWRNPVKHSVHHDRSSLQTTAFTGVVAPCKLKLLHIGRIDLRQRRVVLCFRRAPVGRPILVVAGLIFSLSLRGRARYENNKNQEH